MEYFTEQKLAQEYEEARADFDIWYYVVGLLIALTLIQLSGLRNQA